MRFHRSSAEIFIPDGLPEEAGLRRTTHLAIGAHQDDIEIMAAAPILECFQREDLWFSGVVMTDGSGSPRDDLYKDYTDEAMRQVRRKEQKKAAVIGEYAAQVMLDYPSRVIKDGSDQQPVEDLVELIKTTHPSFIYTHNLADKHDTHVSVTIRVVTALRKLRADEHPQALYGCEVWRDLDWLPDTDKVAFPLSSHGNLQAALLGVFDSQISGGKRYDLATMGRRQANATYFESLGVDTSRGLSYAMDLTPLILDPGKEISEFIQEHIRHFAQDVTDRLKRVG
ncbi:MAG: GlcNAc-PI de-N-acetylase [Chloroflexi bacterium RBG_16_54_11]|nr:MAG: GlcNAc-PI de-N-acetylase [Chloroflexi bacterium RBG_16_54_11]